uniref:DNA repair protein RAD50 n=2 Tax=Rhodosorus marinus TaxID=101924 RepID=A0A7S2ZYB6_9RHOD|mmetsp:Transcript_35004/g.138675  ORF Transcript_35004/g.138675 Transcript_35004/m.138675 type:complete len:864 (+) Transcript_35004:1610-4201(+)
MSDPISGAEDPEEELVLEKERLRRATESLDALKQKGTSRMDSAHKENQRALHELRNRISSLHDERRTISQSEDTRARVEFLKEQLQEKTEAIKVKEAKILAYAKSVSQGTLSQESSALHEILATTIEDMDKGWRDLEASILEEKALMRATEFELNFMNTRVDELKKDAGLVNQRIQESAAQRTPQLTYDQIEDQLEKEKQLAEELLEEARMQRFGGEFIKSLIERGQETECCPTCTRSFESPIDLDALIKTLTKRMQRSLGEKLAEKERAAASQRSKCDNLATLIPLYKEKTVLDRRVEEEGKIRDDRAAALSKLAGSARAREIDVAFASSRAKEIDELKRLQQELGLLRKERERIEKDLEEERKKHGMSKFSRTISDIDEELIACHDQSDKLAKESEKLQEQREAHFAEISNGDKAVHDQKEKLRNLEYQVEDRKRVQTEVLELSSAAADLELKLKSLADQLAEVSEEEREAKKRVGDREDEFAKEEKLGREKLTSLRDLVSSFKKIKASIESYSTAEKDDELERLELRSDEVEKKIKELNTELKKLEGSDASDADKSLQFEQMMRNMNDNLRYRKIAKQVSEIESEIVKAWSDIEEIEEGRQVEEDHRKTLSVLSKLNSQRMSTEGKSLGFQHRLDALGEDIKRADLKGSHKAYNRIVIDVKTVELASADLEKYHRALDHALMTYHTMKMSEINKTVKELWQTTYQGNDIDYIEIASDADNADSVKLSSPAKRNYNYRVVMRRGDALLDMRGRCSAGQKVLACLIIRLALAESFAFDCGILALDEPTTNLDQRNIEKLSASLADIINNRRKQSNFQLILITHDEQFIELLGSREICDSYYLVYKDNDGFSRVKQQELISFA